MLTDVLALLNPEAFGRSERIRANCCKIAAFFKTPDLWQIETAAMLSQIGCVVLPHDTLTKIYKGQDLEEHEKTAFEKHPLVGYDLLSNIPRMREVAGIIACQNHTFDGSGSGNDGMAGDEIPLGARILKAVLDFDLLESKGQPKGMAFKKLKSSPGIYDPEVLTAFEKALGTELSYRMQDVSLEGLKAAMILREDVRTFNDMLMIAKGQVISEISLSRLKALAMNTKIREPIRVFVPYGMAE